MSLRVFPELTLDITFPAPFSASFNFETNKCEEFATLCLLLGFELTTSRS